MLWVPEPGDVVGDHVLVERLGSGGFGWVWLARNPSVPAPVALKILKPALMVADRRKGPSPIDRFVSEARILQKLDHPGLVRVYGVIEDRERSIVAYSMERLRGKQLGHMQRSLDLSTILGVLGSAASTLHYVHEQGIIHRDVTMANIVVCRPADAHDDPLAVKLIDFGVAKDQSDDAVLERTRQGMLVGQPPALSPETFARLSGEERELTSAVDQWSLGIILYRCVSGEHPFDTSSVMALAREVQHEPVPDLQIDARFAQAGLRSVPTAVDEIVETCLQKRPERRYASTKALADALFAARAELLGTAETSISDELADTISEPGTRWFMIEPFVYAGDSQDNAVASSNGAGPTPLHPLKVDVAHMSPPRLLEEQDASIGGQEGRTLRRDLSGGSTKEPASSGVQGPPPASGAAARRVVPVDPVEVKATRLVIPTTPPVIPEPEPTSNSRWILAGLLAMLSAAAVLAWVFTRS